MFNITLAGVLGNDVNLIRLTDELFGQIKAYLFTKEAEPEIKILVSDEYTDESWRDKISMFPRGGTASACSPSGC